jgi:hypothetical protein
MIAPSFVSYGCETWSVTLREEHELHVSENEEFMYIYGSKKKKVNLKSS